MSLKVFNKATHVWHDPNLNVRPSVSLSTRGTEALLMSSRGLGGGLRDQSSSDISAHLSVMSLHTSPCGAVITMQLAFSRMKSRRDAL